MDKLYENIGGKIKKWAKWIFIVEAVCTIITGFILLFDCNADNVLWILLIIILGPIVAFVSTWILYAFGQLVEDVHYIRNSDIIPQTYKKSNSQVEKNTTQKNGKNEVDKTGKQQTRKTTKSQDQDTLRVLEKNIEVTCPQCKEKLTFWESTENPECPFCGCQIKL